MKRKSVNLCGMGMLFLLGLITRLLEQRFTNAPGPFGTPGGCDEWRPPPCIRCRMERRTVCPARSGIMVTRGVLGFYAYAPSLHARQPSKLARVLIPCFGEHSSSRSHA